MGKGNVYQCAGCGFQQEYLTGIGFMAPREAEQERENILAGNYGPKAQAALQSHPETVMDVKAAYQIAKADMEGRVLARCLDAGDLWVFCFELPGADDLTPGDFPKAVDKATGKAHDLILPDDESFRILSVGKTVPVRSVRGRKRIV